MQAHDRQSICERGGVPEARGNNRRCWKAIDDDVRVARDGVILSIREHQCKMALLSTPACCLDGCRNFQYLLPMMVDGGGCWLADDLVKRQWHDDGSYSLVDSGFICGG